MSEKRKWMIAFAVGTAFVAIYYFAFFFLGEQALIIYHDQLDGEILSYMLGAKHLGENYIPELFGGVSGAALTPAAPLFVLFYKLFPAFAAYMMGYLFVIIVAYVGMFLCTKEIFGLSWLSCTVAVIFTMLPFYSVYGMSVMGQPLLLYAVILLWKNYRSIKGWALILLFALSSSLVLVGYVDILLVALAALAAFIKKKRQYRQLLLTDGVLCLLYMILNWQLLTEIFFHEGGFVSHKTEMTANGSSLMSTFWNMLKEGAYHAGALHEDIYYYMIPAVVLLLFLYHRMAKEDKNRFKAMVVLGAYCVFAAGFYALWRWYPVAELRTRLGGIFTSFQADRFYWLYPCVWYLLFGFILYFLYAAGKKKKGLKVLTTAVSVVLTANLLLSINAQNNESVNIQKLLGIYTARQDGYTTWESFYSEELFDEIEEYIGKDQKEYKVGSVGLYPSIALYNGFYCIDGYSGNYDVEYKHAFRKIIEKELDKNEELKKYFDDWGSRCYLFVAEIPFSYLPGKNNDIVLKDVEFNTDQLQRLGCEYLFSGYLIENPEEKGLEFCRKFENGSAGYDVFLYKVR